MFTGQTIERAVEVTRASVGLPVGSRVVAAMSGGVDSSVVAALLKHAGYDVVGVTLQLYDHGGVTSRKGACCAGKDILDARNVASALSIPHFVLDYEARFQSAVIDNFADTYVRGETPVPCIRCNQTVKFRDLLERSHVTLEPTLSPPVTTLAGQLALLGRRLPVLAMPQEIKATFYSQPRAPS